MSISRRNFLRHGAALAGAAAVTPVTVLAVEEDTLTDGIRLARNWVETATTYPLVDRYPGNDAQFVALDNILTQIVEEALQDKHTFIVFGISLSIIGYTMANGSMWRLRSKLMSLSGDIIQQKMFEYEINPYFLDRNEHYSEIRDQILNRLVK